MSSQTVKNIRLMALLNIVGFTIALVLPWAKLSDSGGFESRIDAIIPFKEVYASRFVSHISGEYRVSSPVEINAFSCESFTMNETKSTPATVVEKVLRCEGLETVREKGVEKFRLDTRGVVRNLPEVVLTSSQPFSVNYIPDPWGFEVGLGLGIYAVIVVALCAFFNWFFYWLLFK